MSVTVTRVAEATVVTLRWTERRNALGPAEADQVADALEEAGRSDGRALVLTGEGAFCAGGDLPAIVELSTTHTPAQIREAVYGRYQRIMRGLRESPIPTIAAVDGAAVGLGMDLALACDMRFVGPGGWMRQGWAAAGLVAGTGGVGFLQRRRPDLVWRLIAEQPRLDQAACVAERLGEAAESSALDAALGRAAQLAQLAPDVLAAYCDLAREDTWPVASHFERSATHQSGFIASDAFRRRAAELLAPRSA
jgi:enoyl-CoA hydratase